MVDDLVRRVVQYIGIKEDKRKFRVYTQLKVYLENQPIVFDAQLFNESYEPVNTEDVFITITSADRKDYQFTLAKRRGLIPLTQGFSLPVAINIQRASIPKLVSKKSKDSSSYKESNSRPIRVRQTTTC